MSSQRPQATEVSGVSCLRWARSGCDCRGLEGGAGRGGVCGADMYEYAGSSSGAVQQCSGAASSTVARHSFAVYRHKQSVRAKTASVAGKSGAARSPGRSVWRRAVRSRCPMQRGRSPIQEVAGAGGGCGRARAEVAKRTMDNHLMHVRMRRCEPAGARRLVSR